MGSISFHPTISPETWSLVATSPSSSSTPTTSPTLSLSPFGRSLWNDPYQRLWYTNNPMSKKLSSKRLLLAAVFLLSLIALFYFWDVRYKWNLQLLSSLLGGAVAAILVTEVFSYREQIKWKQTRSIFLQGISHLSDRMLTGIGPVINVHLPSPGAPGFEEMSKKDFIAHTEEIFSKHFSEDFTPFTKQPLENIQLNRQLLGYCVEGIESAIREVDGAMSTPPPTALSPELLKTIMTFRRTGHTFTTTSRSFLLSSSAPTDQVVVGAANLFVAYSLQSLVEAILDLRTSVNTLLSAPN